MCFIFMHSENPVVFKSYRIEEDMTHGGLRLWTDGPGGGSGAAKTVEAW